MMNRDILMHGIAMILPAFSLVAVVHAQSSKDLMRRADSLVTRGSYTEAVALLDIAVARNPGNPIYLLARGRSHAAFQQYEDARRDYIAALSIDHDCALCMIDLAAVEAFLLNPHEALALVNRAIGLSKALDPKRMAEAHHLRAQVQETLGNRSDAILDYDRAIRLDPGNPDYLISRGMFHLLGGNSREALTSLSAAVGAAPNLPKPYFYRARYYATVQEWDRGIADLDRCIALDPADPNAYMARGAIYSAMGRFPQALADYNAVISRDPGNADAFYNRALTRFELDDLEGSCNDSRRALELLQTGSMDRALLDDVRRNIRTGCDSSSTGYYLQRGIIEYNRGNFTQAIDIYDRGLKQHPGDAVLLYLRGNAALGAGRHADAARDYEMVLATGSTFLNDISASSSNANPDETRTLRTASLMSIYHGLFEARQALNDFNGALEALDMALALAVREKGPNLDKLHLERGSLLLLKNDHDGALNDLDQAIALNPNLAPAHLFRAMALLGAHSSRLRLSSLRSDAVHGTSTPAAIEVPENPAADPNSTTLLDAALGACDRAIRLDSGLGHAYLVRGYIKILGGTGNHCPDLRRARELGVPEAKPLLGSHCM